jgi:hypothetical protein
MNPILSALFPVVGEVFKRLWPDPADQAKAQLALMQLSQNGELAYLDADLKTRLAQLQIDNTEAASDSFFKSGWRPFIGWTCGSAFAWQFVGHPVLGWIVVLCGHPVDFPNLDLSTMVPVMMGMLGLGAMRTYEKVNGAGK